MRLERSHYKAAFWEDTMTLLSVILLLDHLAIPRYYDMDDEGRQMDGGVATFSVTALHS